MGYVVTVFDRAGRFSETSATDFDHCVSLYRMLRRWHPDKVVKACNEGLCDVDTDGLTDDERERLDAEVS